MIESNIINKVYPGKVLLFGEYTVIHGGDSLAIPLYKKTANWDYDDLEFESRESIDNFVDYLILNGIGEIDIDAFHKEWKKGLFLDSNIPSGYGAGSSGSVVAAVYDGFMKDVSSEKNLLRELFIKMENFFHGSSSGLDPLVSFFGKTVHISNGDMEIREENYRILDNLYLWDSGISRKTSPLVHWYKTQLEKGLKAKIDSDLIPLNEKLIKSFLESDDGSFADYFEKVETFQTTYFIPMFPHSIKQQLNRMKEDYGASFKLCGAGGGGFYLLYSKNIEIQQEANIIPLRN